MEDSVHEKRKESMDYKFHMDVKTISEATSFFKTVTASMIGGCYGGAMMFPRTFTRKFKNQLATKFKLEGPSGQIWVVKSNKDQASDMRLIGGWREFSKGFGLQIGDILIFKLIAPGHFQVRLYGRDNMEKEDTYQRRSELDLSISDVSKRRKMLKREASTCFESMFDQRTIVHANSQNQVDLGTEEKPYHIQNTDSGYIHSEHSDTLLGSKNTYETNSSFVRVIVKPSYVSSKSKMKLPSEFAKKTMPHFEADFVLVDLDTRCWSVKWLGYARGASFSKGWAHFAKDHKLSCGDVCIFEVTRGIFQIKVQILRKDSIVS